MEVQTEAFVASARPPLPRQHVTATTATTQVKLRQLPVEHRTVCPSGESIRTPLHFEISQNSF